jgi:hypothetical protein
MSETTTGPAAPVRDVDAFLVGVNIKPDKKGEVQDLLYGRRGRVHADLVVDIGYRPDLGDVLLFDSVTCRAKLARHVDALWRLSQSSEQQQQQTPLHGQCSEYETELASMRTSGEGAAGPRRPGDATQPTAAS